MARIVPDVVKRRGRGREGWSAKSGRAGCNGEGPRAGRRLAAWPDCKEYTDVRLRLQRSERPLRRGAESRCAEGRVGKVRRPAIGPRGNGRRLVSAAALAADGYFWASEHFLHRAAWRLTWPPQRLQRWYLFWRDFFLRGRNGTGHLVVASWGRPLPAGNPATRRADVRRAAVRRYNRPVRTLRSNPPSPDPAALPHLA